MHGSRLEQDDDCREAKDRDKNDPALIKDTKTKVAQCVVSLWNRGNETRRAKFISLSSIYVLHNESFQTGPMNVR